MPTYTRYKKYQEAGWSLWVWPEKWNDELWRTIRRQLESQRPAKHPQTTEIRLADSNEILFLKVFHRFSALATMKDFFRESKAVHGLKAGAMLADLGFNVASAMAAGEQRNRRVLQRSFLLTYSVAATPVPLFLRRSHGQREPNIPLSEKRDALTRLAHEIRRLHDLGFVHGDLVPSNILVGNAAGRERRFFFLDHDRTRRYPKWFPQSLWKRNLVQLNRFPLAGISLQDRMRFFHAYAGRREWLEPDRHLMRWLEKKTRQRRHECDAVDVSGSFRKLMRWDAKTVQSSTFQVQGVKPGGAGKP
jgi:serine/threonine protein kinase